MRNYVQVYLITILLSTCSHGLFGQNNALIDSLKSELKREKSDTAKIRLLLAIANEYSYSGTKEAFKYISLAKNIYKQVDDEKYLADIFLQEGIILHTSSDLPKAKEKYEKALSIYRKLNLKRKIAHSYLYIGGVIARSSNNNEAVDYYSEAMKIYKLLKDEHGMAACYKLMATIYYKQSNYNKAIEYTNKSIMLADKNNKHYIAVLYLNLFVYYTCNEEPDKALSLADSIFPPLIEANDFESLRKVYINMGIFYSNRRNYKKAKECLYNASYYLAKSGFINYRIENYISLAWILYDENKPDSSILLLKKSLTLNKGLNSLVYNEQIYSGLYDAYEKKGDIKTALEYYKKYIVVRDSIAQDLNNKKLLEIQTQYEVDLKNDQIKILAKNEQLAKQKIFILGVSLLLVLISSLFYISYRHRKTKEKQMLHEAELKEAAYKHELELKEAKYKIAVKQRELIYKAMHISQQERTLSHIKDQLESFNIENQNAKETVMGVLSGINRQLKQNSFEDFEKYFIEVHPEFYENLKENHTALTQNELRICALLRLNLNTKQIADITGKSIRSVETTRTDIRKKMKLSSQDNLFDVVSNI